MGKSNSGLDGLVDGLECMIVFGNWGDVMEVD